MAALEFTTEELSNEVWKQIPEYDGRYEASNLGRIRSYASGGPRIRSIGFRTRYPTIQLYNGGTKSGRLVHRLVALAFLGDPPADCEVNHIDGIRTNNRIENLEYVTHLANMQHAVSNGLMRPLIGPNGRHHFRGRVLGERQWAAKLIAAQVLEIRKRVAAGESKPVLAVEFGVHVGTIYQIRARKIWKHI